jgi:hypothetical protein
MLVGPIGTLDLVTVSGDAGALNEPLRRYTTRWLSPTPGDHPIGGLGYPLDVVRPTPWGIWCVRNKPPRLGT